MGDVDEAMGNWLAGFTDGEGCFTVARNYSRRWMGYKTRFEIDLRDDDAEVLYAIRRATGIGTVRRLRNKTGGKHPDAVRWSVDRKLDCERLVGIFDRFPLRAKKARDFAIWRMAVQAWRAQDWARLHQLKRDLELGRRYATDGFAVYVCDATPEPCDGQLCLLGDEADVRS